jgi:uncharacterized glyoxalase superfamily protein PhnB
MPESPAERCTQTIPCLGYADAHAAIDWLVRVLGADAHALYPGPDGRGVAHAELWFGRGCLMLGSLKEGRLPPTVPGQGAVYLVLESAEAVDALHDRAVAAGARIVVAPHDTDYGSHDFACLDVEGNFLAFGTYAPSREAPAAAETAAARG